MKNGPRAASTSASATRLCPTSEASGAAEGSGPTPGAVTSKCATRCTERGERRGGERRGGERSVRSRTSGRCGARGTGASRARPRVRSGKRRDARGGERSSVCRNSTLRRATAEALPCRPGDDTLVPPRTPALLSPPPSPRARRSRAATPRWKPAMRFNASRCSARYASASCASRRRNATSSAIASRAIARSLRSWCRASRSASNSGPLQKSSMYKQKINEQTKEYTVISNKE